MKCEKHEWETLDDGSRICFECDEREESQAPLKKIGRQPDRDYDRNPPGIPVEATVETDICQNRHKGNPQSESAFESIREVASIHSPERFNCSHERIEAV